MQAGRAIAGTPRESCSLYSFDSITATYRPWPPPSLGRERGYVKVKSALEYYYDAAREVLELENVVQQNVLGPI